MHFAYFTCFWDKSSNLELQNSLSFKEWISVKSLSAYRCLFMILLPAKLWPVLFKYSLGFQLWELTGKNESILNSLHWNFMPTMNSSWRSAPKVIKKRMLIWGAKLCPEKKQPLDLKPFTPQSLSSNTAPSPVIIYEKETSKPCHSFETVAAV